MELDLVMWGKDCERTVSLSLRSINSRIPGKFVANKIYVDYKSEDASPSMAEELGWAVYQAPAKGIPSAANLALEKVSSPLFATFEADLVLSRGWFEAIVKWMEDPTIGVAQGIRLPTHPVLRHYDQFVYEKERRKVEDYGISIDNNLYRTDLIKKVGGFPSTCPIAVDRNLRDKVEEAGYKWKIDPTVVSSHLRGGLWQTIQHDVALLSKIRRRDQLVTSERVLAIPLLPVRALRMVKYTRDPILFFYVVLHRLARIKVVLQRRKTIRELTSLERTM